MAKSVRSYFLKATEISIPTSAIATNEDNINDLNTSTDNINTKDNVDCWQNEDKQTSINVDCPKICYHPKADFKFPKRFFFGKL